MGDYLDGEEKGKHVTLTFDGKIETIVVILKINKGPFLSTNIPKIGPIIITNIVCIIPENCKAVPLIPIKAPNVGLVVTI